MAEINGLRPIRCSFCGRFHGVGRIINGELYLKCSNCKQWTCVLEGDKEMELTGKQIYDKLKKISE